MDEWLHGARGPGSGVYVPFQQIMFYRTGLIGLVVRVGGKKKKKNTPECLWRICRAVMVCSALETERVLFQSKMLPQESLYTFLHSAVRSKTLFTFFLFCFKREFYFIIIWYVLIFVYCLDVFVWDSPLPAALW